MGHSKKNQRPVEGPEPRPTESAGNFPDRVETYSGSRLHECPRRLIFQGERLEVTRILARWQEPEHLVFIVAAQSSRRYLLKYHQPRDVWEIQIWPESEPTPE